MVRATRFYEQASIVMITHESMCREEVIARLESLLHEVDIREIRSYESVDANGTQVLNCHVMPWPSLWPFDGCRELWQASVAHVLDGCFNEREKDGGLLRWFHTQAQPFVTLAGSYSRLANPFNVWLNGLRKSNEIKTGIERGNVGGDPRIASENDMEAVSEVATFLAGHFVACFEEIDRLEKSIRRLQPRCGERINPVEEHPLKTQLRSLRGAQMSWCRDCILADLVWHYTSVLLPDLLAECRQISRRLWLRPNEIDWTTLENEFDCVAHKFQGLLPKKRIVQSTSGTSSASGIHRKPDGRGRRMKFADPDESAIREEYNALRSVNATIASLNLSPKGGLSAEKRVERIANRDRARRSRERKKA